MKKTFKRMTALIVAAMLTLALVSCGGGDESSKAAETSKAAESTADASKADVSADASADASVDASADASVDASVDASEDASVDASVEPDVSVDIEEYPFDAEELTVWNGKVIHNASLLGGGSFALNALGELETTGEGNLGVVLNDTFKTGKISATLIAAGGAEGDNDNGIIFGLGEGDDYFWETEGRSYYFLFVSDACALYLAKVGVNPDAAWEALQVVSLADAGITYVHGMEITIFAEVKADGTIICGADGKEIINYKDESPLTGEGYGVRGEWTQVAWSDLTVEKK